MLSDLRLNAGLSLLVFVVLVAGACIGTAALSPSETLAALFGQGAETSNIIVQQIRLPRLLAAFGVGAALGLAGAGLQGLLQNPLAGPGVLGISAASTLGAVIAIFFGVAALSSFAVPVFAIGFAFAAALVLMLVAGRGASTVTLLLVGIGVSSFAGALTTLALNLAPNPYALSDLVNWLLGSVANRSWLDIGLAAPFWVVGAALMVWTGPGLRAMSLGDETAASLGADPKQIRLLIVFGTSLLVGASVAVAGTIGFVGLVAPHFVRATVDHDPQRVLLPSALLGGVILMLSDMFVRIAPFDQELKLGVVAALIGAPVFIWIAARLGGGGR